MLDKLEAMVAEATGANESVKPATVPKEEISSMEAQLNGCVGGLSDPFPVADDYSTEAYFGKNCTFSKEMVLNITNLKNVVVNLAANVGEQKMQEVSGDIDKLNAYAKKDKDFLKLKNCMREFESCVKRNVGFETVHLTVYNENNAYSVSKLFDAEKYVKDKARFNESVTWDGIGRWKGWNDIKDINENLVSHEDIFHTDKGFSIKQGTNISASFGIGIKIIMEQDVDTIAAIMFHEIGHSLQSVITGANADILDSVMGSIASSIGKYYGSYCRALGTMQTILLDPFYGKIDKDLNGKDKRRFLKTLQEYTIDRAKRIVFFSGRNEDNTMATSDERDAKRGSDDKLIDSIAGSIRNKSQLMLSTVASTIQSSLLANMVGGMINSPMNLMICINAIRNPNNGEPGKMRSKHWKSSVNYFLNRNKRYENFADTYAAMFGFAAAGTEFHLDTLEYVHGVKTKRMGIMEKIVRFDPILGTIKAMNDANDDAAFYGIAGYDTTTSRIANSVRILEHELQYNKDLSSSMRKEIEKDIDRINDVYKDSLKVELDMYAGNFITRAIIKRSMYHGGDMVRASNSSDIEALVLDKIDELQDTGRIVYDKQVIEFHKKIRIGGSSSKTEPTKLNFIPNLLSKAIEMLKLLPKNIASMISGTVVDKLTKDLNSST